jgi:hypothetical protein
VIRFIRWIIHFDWPEVAFGYPQKMIVDLGRRGRNNANAEWSSQPPQEIAKRTQQSFNDSGACNE